MPDAVPKMPLRFCGEVSTLTEALRSTRVSRLYIINPSAKHGDTWPVPAYPFLNTAWLVGFTYGTGGKQIAVSFGSGPTVP
jgi:hypothetical protein